MNEWKPLPHDEDLERADDLLDQADALLRRHRSTIDFTPGAPFHDAGRDQPSESNLESLDLEDEDLPILTEVVEDLEIADDWHPPINARPLDFGPIAPPALTPVAPGSHPPPAAATESATPHSPEPQAAPAVASPDVSAALLREQIHEQLSHQFAEQLIDLDTRIAREVSNWMATEFPQVVGRELDRLVERLHIELQAHLRATLLPDLSGRISEVLEDIQSPLKRH